MGNKQLSVVLFVFVCHELAFSSSTLPQLCNKDQSIPLLKFKQTLIVSSFTSGCVIIYGQNSYPKTKMNTWDMSRDCCLWDGVICDEFTGHVIELDLSCSHLEGIIDSNCSLFQLAHLQKLDLYFNDFYPSEISHLFGRFSHLTHLDLSYSNFTGLHGALPESIFHLLNLQVLNLGGNFQLSGYFPKTKWNSSASLRGLRLSYVPFSGDFLPVSVST
uniref:Receptor-like protein 12 n=1 Tax=Nicotiana sylvestris TaxID=4096 RepID=A0A1U7Y362_NICSY|nr:PREDICTED: receptor-like protein 12 [Nicotiana sylvestris]